MAIFLNDTAVDEVNTYESTYCRPSEGCERSSSVDNYPFSDDDVSFHTWTDVTEEFMLDTKEIAVGQLVHDNGFSLFDAMSAIELMDPKMDAGMLPNDIVKVDFKAAVQTGRIRLSDVPACDLIMLMDATLSTLISWLEGHSLAQTVFINLYMHNTPLINDRLTRSFCQAILKLISVCHEINRRANVFEDEDFQQMLYNFDLLDDLSCQRIIGILKDADDECQKTIRIAKTNAEPDKLVKLNEYEALAARFRFIRYFMTSLLALTAKQDNESYNTTGSAAKKLNFEEARKNLTYCDEYLSKMADSVNFVQNKDFGSEDSFTYAHLKAFELNVNQQLLPPTFPRHTTFLEPTKAIAYLRRLVERLIKICSLPDHTLNFDTALDFFRHFSRSESCMLSRSILQIAFMPMPDKVLGRISLGELVKEAARDFISPPILNSVVCANDNVSDCKRLVDDFFGSFAKIAAELIRIAGHNRARQRDCYAVVLEDLSNLQEEADRLDNQIHSILNSNGAQPTAARNHLARLGSYVLYHVLGCMVEYLTLGFELELYSAYEYSYIFWYLNEFLFKWLVNVLHKADSMLYEQDQYLVRQEKSKNDKKKAKAKKKALKSHRFEILHVQSYQKMCEAYYRAMMGFHALKRIAVPSYGNSDEHDGIRYEHRLAPFFHVLTPPVIGFQQYLEISNFKQIVAKIPASRLFTDSAVCFEESRLSLEKVPLTDERETADLIKVCKLNAVVLKLLATGSQDSQTEWPRFEFFPHKIYPVIKLK